MRPPDQLATRIAEQVREGTLPPGDPTAIALDRIYTHDPRVRAFVHVDDTGARRSADALSEHSSDGRLLGVPVGVKDVIDTADMPTQHGSPIFAGHRPAGDAAAVGRLRAAGAVVIGKTVTNELGASHPGPTRNPHDQERTPGGSSSGSAAAVAAGFVPVALGTQTGGSIVRPASFCGVLGMKPTRGLLDQRGVGGHCPTIDTLGLLARSTGDLSLTLEVLAGDRWPGEREPTITSLGIMAPPEADLAASTRRGWTALLEKLRTSPGLTVADAAPAVGQELLDAPLTIIRTETAEHLGHLLDRHTEQLSHRLTAAIEHGRRIPRSEYEAALASVRAAEQDLPRLFGGHHALLGLTVTHEAPRGIDTSGDPAPHRLWSALGVPVVSLPLLRGPTDLPIGVLLIGRPEGDVELLRLAHRLLPYAVAPAGSPPVTARSAEPRDRR